MKKPQRTQTALEHVRRAAEDSCNHADSRVILRQRDVLMYELTATDEHVAGLIASLSVVCRKRSALAARIEGMTKALDRRAR